MKLVKIEIQITLLTIFIGAAVIGSGYLVYQSLSQIIDSIHKEARPDFKLLLIKDISAELTEVENSVRLYSLTANENYIYKFHDLNKSVQEKLTDLEDYAIPESAEILQIDSIRLLSNRKLAIWSDIRALHRQKIARPNTPLTELYSKIDTVLIQPDTIKFEPAKKKGFFKRLFGKQDTTTQSPIIIDKTEEKEQLKQEIAEIEQQISVENQQLKGSEKELLERNIQVTAQINRLINQLEIAEHHHLETKTQEADYMAAQIYRHLVLFTGASLLLLLVVLILFFQNLRRNKAYQNILTKARADAENLAKAKERFVATVSHEMRTPVNAIYGLSEQMLQQVTDEKLKADLNVVFKSADHLISLVNDTLDFSKIESQTMTFEQIDFIPAELFREIITLHQVPARSKGLVLELINAIPENRVLKGDPIRLKQILINLFTNAIKFTDRGKITLEAAEEKLAGHYYKLIVDVVDSGVGIPKDNLSKIFEEFVQLDGDNAQKHRGAGLGLAIVKKLVDLQGGEIRVKSLVGKGTRFTIEIPYAEGAPEVYQATENKIATIPEWFKKLHLLLVDDEEFNLYLLKNILTKWAVNYTEATNGLEAVLAAQKQRFDVILMDLRMPVMNGFEASAKIREQNPEALIVMLTANKQPEDQEQMKESGVWTFLQKPFPERTLFDILLQLKDNIGNRDEFAPSPAADHLEFDFQELKNSFGGDEAFLKEMVLLFIQSGEKCCQSIDQALQNRDRNELAEAAHKLAAPAKHMLATQLYNQLKELEAQSPVEESWKTIENMVDQIKIRINSVLDQLRKVIN
ncbi:ATP-binding protein [Mangrovibacterium sp.]|uniref:hybrid sensor histidine kinase/response regulator n=1 Tax=Mangrovibacterium sp. TaxID=1961364 RepID=UPI0035626D31